jgi:hypothetical protein
MMVCVVRRGLGTVALAGALGLGLLACGSQPETTTKTTKPPPSPTKTAQPTTKAPPSMPGTIILRRTGGIAGFMDVLTVAQDGTATLQSRGKEAFSCTVKPEVRAGIEAAAAEIMESPAPPSRDKRGKDDLKTATPDILHLSLTVGEVEVRYADLQRGQSAYRDLFTLMNDVMTSTAAIRGGHRAGPDSACTA